MVTGIEGMAWYVDYVCADEISKLELLSKAKNFKLEEEVCTIWWLDVHSENKGYKEVVTNLDALTVTMSVDSSKELYVCIRVKDQGWIPGGNGDYVGGLGGVSDQEAQGCGPSGNNEKIVYSHDVEEGSGEDDLEEILTGTTGEEKKVDEEIEFYDLDYNFDEDSNEEYDENRCTPRAVVAVDGESPGLGDDAKIQFDYAESEELHSCSLKDSEELISVRPKSSE